MSSEQERRVLVTGAGGPMGVNVTRSLKAAQPAPWLLGTDCNAYHLQLCLTDRRVLVPPASQLQEYLSTLQTLVREEGITMLLPTHPSEVRVLAAHLDLFPEQRSLLPPASAVLQAQNKWSTWQLLCEAGLPVPRTYFIEERGDVQRCFDEVEARPIWVRGAGVPGGGIGVASLPCRSVEHAVAWIEYWRGWGGFIASEYLPGRNLTWLGLFASGALIASQARQRIEYVIPHVSPSGITGAPAVSHTLCDAEVHRMGEAAVRALLPEPNGPFFVDMTDDPSGQPRITEINAGRFGTTIHFYTEAGCNFPELAMRLAHGEQIEGAPLIDPIEAGTYWIRTLDCGPVLVRAPDGFPGL